MDKNAIKKYAVWARRELIEKVSQKALYYGIEDGKDFNPKLESINGVLLSDIEKKQRQALIGKIKESSFTQVMEEVAYTWFNRFIALRFMEVNGYLPSHVRIFTDETGSFRPQIMSEALRLDIEGIEMEKVYALKKNNMDDDLFKYLLITQCNALSDILPMMFQKIADYTELLLPDYLLREGSVIERMVNQKEGIPEEDWQDQVQIIGWLYQYYNTDPKDKVFSDLKKNVKITKETIPAATQLFTPDWIVHYMVENSLGKLWLEGHPNDLLKSEWKYYLNDAEQKHEVQQQLNEISKEYATLRPEEIKCIDPCMGSGHILCVLFDTFVKIYEDYGYSARDAVPSIIENNIWGLDIDERAAQLAYFAVMMKARQYDRLFFTRGIQPHVYAIETSNNLECEERYEELLLDNECQDTLSYILDEFKDAKEYGSILNIQERDYDRFKNTWNGLLERGFDDMRVLGWYMHARERVLSLACQAKVLAQKYDVVVTNPPYMGSSGMDAKLSAFIKKYYKDSKSDLFACFIEKGNKMIKKHGFNCMVTMQSWMFLSSFEKMRKNVLAENDITNLMHMDNMVMGIAFGTAVTLFRKGRIAGYRGTYNHIKLRDIDGDNPREFPVNGNRFSQIETDVFESIPGGPIAYWIDEKLIEDFRFGKELGKIAYPRQGMATTNNDRFLRQWFEVSINKIGFNLTDEKETVNENLRWFPYNKGGEYRKWYGNNDYVVNFQNKGEEVCEYIDSHSAVNHTGRVINRDRYFKPSVTWSKVSSGTIAFRYKPNGFIFDVAGTSIFGDENTLFALMGFLNSRVVLEILACLSPTLNYEVGHICSIPVLQEVLANKEVIELARENTNISKEDWDSFEASWDFDKNPLIPNMYSEYDLKDLHGGCLLKNYYDEWEEKCEKRFQTLKRNEERLNELFIQMYGIKESVNSQVEDKNVTIRKANLSRDIRYFISYVVGCIFGRYSLIKPGVAFAGGDWDPSEYKIFIPDEDAIIPICDDEYFSDDIVGRVIEFVEIVYGKDTLEENLQFIADALGGNGSAREVIRNYFINDFYADHLKMYQKRPIYWLFDSGKKNGFKCLIYMHRYQPDMIARIRTDYVHEQQARYRTAIEETSNRIESALGSDKVKLNKKLNMLKAQDDEIHAYEEKIHHLADQMISIDLDDGVKHNYELFKDVLAKLK